MSQAITMQSVIDDHIEYMFGERTVDNAVRGGLVEAMVNVALAGHGWRRKAPWSGWDFEHTSGCRLEVKQTAAKQSWDTVRDIDRTPLRFEIPTATGHYDDGGAWEENTTGHRLADLYVFAIHLRDGPTADHRDPTQWRFCVVRADVLGKQQSILWRTLDRCNSSVGVDGLAAAVAAQQRGFRRAAHKLPSLIQQGVLALAGCTP
jgi:hypothetical protein